EASRLRARRAGEPRGLRAPQPRDGSPAAPRARRRPHPRFGRHPRLPRRSLPRAAARLPRAEGGARAAGPREVDRRDVHLLHPPRGPEPARRGRAAGGSRRLPARLARAPRADRLARVPARGRLQREQRRTWARVRAPPRRPRPSPGPAALLLRRAHQPRGSVRRRGAHCDVSRGLHRCASDAGDAPPAARLRRAGVRRDGRRGSDPREEGPMIDLYYWPTPNGWKVSIMLEECGLAYRAITVDIGAGEQFKPDFLRISPNNRMPAIVDHEPSGGGRPLSLFESGAILEYLADKAGRFLARSGPDRYATLQWVHWQMANLGPMMGNANHFKNYAKQLVDDPRQLAYGTQRFVGEVDRLCGVMDAQLSAHPHLAGAEYTIADIVSWPWASLLGHLIDENVWTGFPHLKRWVD